MLACLGLLACLLAVPALAEEGESAVPEGEIPAQWQQVMEEAPMTQEEFQSQTAQGWLALAGEALQEAAQAPLRLFLKLCGILLLLAAAKTLCTENERQFEWLAALCVFALCSQDFTALIAQMETALSECKAYLVSFVPVFASVLASCGQAGSAAIYSGLFFTAALLVCDVLCNVGLPAVRIFLAFHVTGCVGGGVDLSGLALSLCRAFKWVLGLCATLFGALISLQGVFAQSADTLALKTGKFILGSSIPVVGKAVSDAMGSVLAGLKMLKGGVGFAAVAVVAAAFLPMMLHCVAYQFFFVALQSVAGALELHRTEKLLGGLGQCAGLLLAMAFFFCFVVVSATMVMILLGNGG